MTRPGSDRNSPGSQEQPPVGRGPSALIWRWWNLLLLLPVLMLITPWFNKDHPRLFGLPFFYWYQLAFVLVGVACVAIVYTATRTHPIPKPAPTTHVASDDRDLDDRGFDEGTR